MHLGGVFSSSDHNGGGDHDDVQDYEYASVIDNSLVQKEVQAYDVHFGARTMDSYLVNNTNTEHLRQTKTSLFENNNNTYEVSNKFRTDYQGGRQRICSVPNKVLAAREVAVQKEIQVAVLVCC